MIPTYITDSRSPRYCTVARVQAPDHKIHTVNALVSIAGDRTIERVIRERLGNGWRLLTWQVANAPF